MLAQSNIILSPKEIPLSLEALEELNETFNNNQVKNSH